VISGTDVHAVRSGFSVTFGPNRFHVSSSPKGVLRDTGDKPLTSECGLRLSTP
jgi:hypothetical protein